MGGPEVEVTKMWLTRKEFADRYQLDYRTAGILCGRLPGHWAGEKSKQYRFNANRCDRMYESGELDEVINEVLAG